MYNNHTEGGGSVSHLIYWVVVSRSSVLAIYFHGGTRNTTFELFSGQASTTGSRSNRKDMVDICKYTSAPSLTHLGVTNQY